MVPGNELGSVIQERLVHGFDALQLSLAEYQPAAAARSAPRSMARG